MLKISGERLIENGILTQSQEFPHRSLDNYKGENYETLKIQGEKKEVNPISSFSTDYEPHVFFGTFVERERERRRGKRR